MALFGLGGDGPSFSLVLDEAEDLLKRFEDSLNNKSYLDVTEGNLHARISLVKHDPNEVIYPNGAFGQLDGACNKGSRMKRMPSGIAPYEYKADQFYVFRIKKEFFEQILKTGKKASDGIGYFHPRCNYDRFCLRIDTRC